MSKALKICKAIIFSDDTTISASSKGVTVLQKYVNTKLNTLYEWFCTLKIAKTYFLILFKKRHLQLKIYSIGGTR